MFTAEPRYGFGLPASAERFAETSHRDEKLMEKSLSLRKIFLDGKASNLVQIILTRLWNLGFRQANYYSLF